MAKKKRKGYYKKGTKPKTAAKQQSVKQTPAAKKDKIHYEDNTVQTASGIPKPKEDSSIRETLELLEKKQLIAMCAGGVLISALIISQIALFSQNRRYTKMYEAQVSVNRQLEELIETLGSDVSAAGNEMPVVAGETNSSEPYIDEEINRGYFTDIPPAVREQMDGNSMGSDSPVSYDDLAYLTVPYYSFDGEILTGHIIVAKDIADETLDIFSELVKQQYPIEKMEITEEFDDAQTDLLNTAEAAARGSNDTFGFYYKKNNGQFVQNSYGRAVEINPKINPRIEEDGSTMPKNAVKYTDRSISLEGAERWAFIGEDYDIVSLFASKGWKWGGADGGSDYGHFEK